MAIDGWIVVGILGTVLVLLLVGILVYTIIRKRRIIKKWKKNAIAAGDTKNSAIIHQHDSRVESHQPTTHGVITAHEATRTFQNGQGEMVHATSTIQETTQTSRPADSRSIHGYAASRPQSPNGMQERTTIIMEEERAQTRQGGQLNTHQGGNYSSHQSSHGNQNTTHGVIANGQHFVSQYGANQGVISTYGQQQQPGQTHTMYPNVNDIQHNGTHTHNMYNEEDGQDNFYFHKSIYVPPHTKEGTAQHFIETSWHDGMRKPGINEHSAVTYYVPPVGRVDEVHQEDKVSIHRGKRSASAMSRRDRSADSIFRRREGVIVSGSHPVAHSYSGVGGGSPANPHLTTTHVTGTLHIVSDERDAAPPVVEAHVTVRPPRRHSSQHALTAS